VATKPANVISFPAAEDYASGVEAVEEEDVTKRKAMPGLSEGSRITATRVSSDGEAIAGNATEDLVEVVTYMARMADLVGELLGMDEFVSIEFSLSDGSCVLNRERNGDLVAARAGHAIDLNTLRESLHSEPLKGGGAR
jgi:hypothetical protein